MALHSHPRANVEAHRDLLSTMNLIQNILKKFWLHLKVIEKIGRFPHRNAALGRETTPEEAEWLAKGGGF